MNIEIFRRDLPSPPPECPQCPSLPAATTSSSRSSGWAAQLMPRRGCHCQRRRDPGEEFRPSSIPARDSLIICWDHSNLLIPPPDILLWQHALLSHFASISWFSNPSITIERSSSSEIWNLSAKKSLSLTREQRVAEVCVWFAVLQPANHRTVSQLSIDLIRF